jgi:hypothetical protein
LDRGSRHNRRLSIEWSATGSADGPREADVRSAKSRANRRPKVIWSWHAQEFRNVGRLLWLCRFAAQLSLQLLDALSCAAQLLELSLLANHLS